MECTRGYKGCMNTPPMESESPDLAYITSLPARPARDTPGRPCPTGEQCRRFVGMDAQLKRNLDDLEEAKMKYSLASPDVAENKKALMAAARERARSCNQDDSHATARSDSQTGQGARPVSPERVLSDGEKSDLDEEEQHTPPPPRPSKRAKTRTRGVDMALEYEAPTKQDALQWMHRKSATNLLFSHSVNSNQGSVYACSEHVDCQHRMKVIKPKVREYQPNIPIFISSILTTRSVHVNGDYFVIE